MPPMFAAYSRFCCTAARRAGGIVRGGRCRRMLLAGKARLPYSLKPSHIFPLPRACRTALKNIGTLFLQSKNKVPVKGLEKGVGVPSSPCGLRRDKFGKRERTDPEKVFPSFPRALNSFTNHFSR